MLHYKTMKHLLIGFGVFAVVALGYFFWYEKSVAPSPETTQSLGETIAEATYACDGGKVIDARYMDKAVEIKLSDARSFTLEQTISGSGVRYANEGEAIVFWNKGNTAFVEEEGETTYQNCVEI